MTDCTRVTVSDTIQVPLPPNQAFVFFTPMGETQWAHGWRPRFHVPTDDDSRPGTTFEVAREGHISTWIVVHRELGRLIEYSWIVPGKLAAVVTVACAPIEDGSTIATVTYHMTGLVPELNAEVERFASQFRHFLDYWQTAIAEAASRI